MVKLIKNAIGGKIHVEAQIYEFTLNADVKIQGMDNLLNANFDDLNFEGDGYDS